MVAPIPFVGRAVAGGGWPDPCFPHIGSPARGLCQPFRQPTPSEYVIKPEDVIRINEEIRGEAEKYINQAKAKVNLKGVEVNTAVLRGNPAETLAEYSSKNGVDLIIIATHGRSGVSRWVWGSVADRILRSACIPVMMVRAPGCIPGI